MKTSEIVLSVVLVLFIILIIKQENPDLKLSFNSLNEMISVLRPTRSRQRPTRTSQIQRNPWKNL